MFYASPMEQQRHDGPELFATALGELEAELDWERLGDLYCHEGGEAFFTPGQIEAQTEAGLLIAAGLGEALAGATADGGRSLYVGAALAELAPALCEVLVLGRQVVLVNLPCPEVDELDRALAAVGVRLGRPLPRLHTGQLATLPGTFDHGWLVSVLTDPDAFPALHDRLYGRLHGRTAADGTGRGDPEREERPATRLMGELVARLDPPALLTTTDEELGFATAACRARGWRLDVPSEGRLSAIVGDVVRHCRVVSPA